MMPRGGQRLGAGRPKGSTNLKSLGYIEEIEKSGMTPLEYLTSVYQDEGADESKRIDAAKAAAPYVHAKLNSVELTGKDGGPLETVREVKRIVVDPRNPDT
jgi:hypothetical protein